MIVGGRQSTGGDSRRWWLVVVMVAGAMVDSGGDRSVDRHVSRRQGRVKDKKNK